LDLLNGSSSLGFADSPKIFLHHRWLAKPSPFIWWYRYLSHIKIHQTIHNWWFSPLEIWWFNSNQHPIFMRFLWSNVNHGLINHGLLIRMVFPQ
jgi:hypothetical protein